MTTATLPLLCGFLNSLGFSLEEDGPRLWARRIVAGEEVVLCFCPANARQGQGIREAIKALNKAGRTELGVKTYLITLGSLERSDQELCDDLNIPATTEVDYLSLATQSEKVCNSVIADSVRYIPEKEYVEQRMSPGNRPWSKYMTNWLSSSEGGLVVVLGHAGYGKTCLAHHLGRRLAKEHLRDSTQPVPFVLPLHKHRYVRRFEELVLTHLQDRGILGFTSKAFAFLANNKRIVPILDGFDELAETGGLRVARETLKGLIEQLADNAKVVLTSRQAYFRHKGDLSLYGDPNGFMSRIQTIELEPFQETERKVFLEKRGLSSQQVRDVEKSVKGLAAEELWGSPLMLGILSE